MNSEFNTNSNIPKLRFPEFSGEWEKKKLEEVGQVLNGLTYSPKDIVKKGLLVLRSSNIQNDKITYDDCVYVRDDIQNVNISKTGDIIICVRNGSSNLIGKNAIITDKNPKSTHGAFMTSLRSNQSKFIIQLLKTNSYKRQVHVDLGARINSINSNQLKKYKFYFPSLPEQQKIASFLESVDSWIDNLKNQKESLEKYKKGIMQKIFAQEIRFKDENGKDFPDWEEKKLGEYLQLSQRRNKTSNIGLVLSVSNKRGFIAQTEQFGDHRVASRDVLNYRIVEKGDFAYNPSRINVGSIAYLKNFDIGIVSPMYVVFKIKDSLDKSFFESMLKTHYFNYLIKIGCSGSVRDTLNFEDMAKFKLKFPDIKEQQKIASFFSSIDELIQLKTQQIEKAEEWKKGLMQGLFV